MKNDYRILTLNECVETVIDNRGKTPPNIRGQSYCELLEVNAITGDKRHPNYSVVRKFVDKKTYSSWFRKGHPKKSLPPIINIGL